MGSISHLPSQKRLRLILFGRRQLASLQRRPSLNPFSIRQSQCLASLSLACDRHFLKAWFSKSGGRKRDLKKLGTEIDELRKDLEKVCVVMTQAVSSQTRLVEAASGLVGEKWTP